jgi:hypothetical protein
MAQIFAKHAGLVAVLTALPILCSAQEKRTFIPVVPAADWRQAESQPSPLAAVSKYGGEPAVEHEYGVKALELRTYRLGKTRTQVVVEPTPDAISAYGLLTFYQTSAMTPEKGIQLAVGDANQTLMARGSNFIRFLRSPESSLSENEYQALLVFVGGSKPSASTMQDLPRPMPPKGLVPGSEKYLLGLEAAKRVLPSFRTDLIGFEQSAEVQMGQYQTGKGTSTLLSIEYPTPQIARVRFGALTNFLGLNQDKGADSVYGKRHHSYVFLVLNAGNAPTASALMDQFDVTESISWDQKYNPERTFTLQLVHMILAIFLLTAFLIGGCIVAGVLFFLSRRFAAKFFPDSQWGHPDDDQLIRLNLKAW